MILNKIPDTMRALRLDPFTVALVATVAVASFLPVSGRATDVVDGAVKIAVMLLFFLHGARLSREAVLQGVFHWRLHLVVLASTFVLFPLLGFALKPLADRVLEPSLYLGVLFLCCLPSTVQSSIAFTSIARGNVPAAVCAASASNLFGILFTPLLTGVLLARHGATSFEAVGSIATLLLLPFIAGQVLRAWIGAWVVRHNRLLSLVDRGSILLMVYAAFSKAVIGGIWSQVSALQLATLLALCCLLLAAVLLLTSLGARRLGFSKEDEITIVFCGSKKSLVTGVPMASVLFPSPQAGIIVLPLMIFHQVQLLVCAVLARRYARRVEISAALTAAAQATE